MDKHRREFENIPITIEELKSSNKLYNQYYKEQSYLYYIDIDEEGNSRLLWLCRYITIVKIIENEDTGDFQYLLEIDTVVGKRQCTTDKLTVTMRRFDKLTAKGFSYNEAYTDFIIKYLLIAENNAEKILRYTCSPFLISGSPHNHNLSIVSRSIKEVLSKVFSHKKYRLLTNSLNGKNISWVISLRFNLVKILHHSIIMIKV